MAKKTMQPASTDPKPITLIVTIFPPRKDKRRVIISGAPEGEMPLFVEGLFPDRHALLDKAFAGVLKREPQIVTVTEPKGPKRKAGEDLPEDIEADQAEAADQLVAEKAAGSELDAAEELPAIEGDMPDAAEQKFIEQLSDIRSSEIETDEEVGNNGEQD